MRCGTSFERFLNIFQSYRPVSPPQDKRKFATEAKGEHMPQQASNVVRFQLIDLAKVCSKK